MGQKQPRYGKRKLRKSLIENTRRSRPSGTSTDVRKHTLTDAVHPDLPAAQRHAPALDCGSGISLFGGDVPTASSPGDKGTFPPKAPKGLQFKCGFCFYITKDQHGMVSHLIHHAEGRRLECQHCPQLPSGWGSACSKDVCCLLETTTNNLFKCCLCTHFAGDQREILNHLFLRCDERLKCQQCSKSFSKAEDLRYHAEIHKPERTCEYQLW
ncbi:zinc finger protein 792 [Ixodes scapularis]|uniref:zinc finger protein 792 n=1 Tax=Ixodes scapularis TaxID=6945 RepID=UPI001A9F9642|nr:zinc finger protein 792 [Ixodes scapularis]